MTNIRYPIGLKEATDAVRTIASKAKMYQESGLCPPDLLLNIERGNGQTYFTRFITAVYKTYAVRTFSELDDVLEFRLQTKIDCIKAVFSEIESYAVFTNEFDGIIAMDITALKACAFEFQVEYFCERIAQLSNSASLIFYLDSYVGADALTKKIVDVDKNLKKIEVKQYLAEELAQILVNQLNDNHVDIKVNDNILKAFITLIQYGNITTVRGLSALRKRLIEEAYSKSKTPLVLSEEDIIKCSSNISKSIGGMMQ